MPAPKLMEIASFVANAPAAGVKVCIALAQKRRTCRRDLTSLESITQVARNQLFSMSGIGDQTLESLELYIVVILASCGPD